MVGALATFLLFFVLCIMYFHRVFCTVYYVFSSLCCIVYYVLLSLCCIVYYVFLSCMLYCVPCILYCCLSIIANHLMQSINQPKSNWLLVSAKRSPVKDFSFSPFDRKLTPCKIHSCMNQNYQKQLLRNYFC